MTPSERTALSDIRYWGQATLEVLQEIESMIPFILSMRPSPEGWSPEQQKIHGKHSNLIDNMLSNANQWYKALDRPELPKQLRRSIDSRIDSRLKEKCQHLRNIKEHWENNRRYFENPSLPILENRNTRSVIWYRKRFPDKSAWSWSWSNIEG